MIAFLALIRKDLLIFFQDRRAVIMAFVAPIIIGSFFGYVFGDGGSRQGDSGRAKVIVVDQDGGPVGQAIVRGMQAEKAFDVKATNLEDAESLVQKGKASVALLIPAEFGKQVLSGGEERPTLTFYVDPSRAVEAKMVQGMLTGGIMAAMGHNRPAPFRSAEVPLAAKRGAIYNAYAHSFGGMAIQFILFLGIDVGIGMLLDRQRGLWKRLASSPLIEVDVCWEAAWQARL